MQRCAFSLQVKLLWAASIAHPSETDMLASSSSEEPVIAFPFPPAMQDNGFSRFGPYGAPLNPIQFNQINKRRAYRLKTGQTTRPRMALIENTASRKEHALRRPRGPGGRFLQTAVKGTDSSGDTSDEKPLPAKKRASKQTRSPTPALPPMPPVPPPLLQWH